jgi:hypothetical protein
LEFAQISIGGIGLDLEFFQTVGEWDLELTQISIGGIRPGLEILPNGHGKIVWLIDFSYFYWLLFFRVWILPAFLTFEVLAVFFSFADVSSR